MAHSCMASNTPTNSTPHGTAHFRSGLVRRPPSGVQLCTSLPGWPAQRWFTAIASRLLMMSQTRSTASSSSRLRPSTSGDETMHHAPKWARSHVKAGGLRLPVSIMSGYAQQPRPASGEDASRNFTTVCRLRIQLWSDASMSLLVLKKLNGHQKLPSACCLGHEESSGRLKRPFMPVQ